MTRELSSSIGEIEMYFAIFSVMCLEFSKGQFKVGVSNF